MTTAWGYVVLPPVPIYLDDYNPYNYTKIMESSVTISSINYSISGNSVSITIAYTVTYKRLSYSGFSMFARMFYASEDKQLIDLVLNTSSPGTLRYCTFTMDLERGKNTLDFYTT
jgi:hypothetical protein